MRDYMVFSTSKKMLILRLIVIMVKQKYILRSVVVLLQY